MARTTSLSVIVPVPLLITVVLTPLTSIFSRAFLTASSLPFTSALSIIFISFTPLSILENKSSNERELVFLFCICFAFSLLASAIDFACFSVSKAINLSPADGTLFTPVISTGVLGNASTISTPKSFFRVLTLPKDVPTTIGSPILKVPF